MFKFRPGDEVTVLGGTEMGQHGVVLDDPIVPPLGPIWYKVCVSNKVYMYTEEYLKNYKKEVSENA